MGDSQSKTFGDKYLDKLTGQLDATAPVFSKSLFSPAGGTTQDAWQKGTNWAERLSSNGGFNAPMRDAVNTFGGLGDAFGDAVTGSDRQFQNIYGGYGALGDNNGLTGQQSRTMAGLNGLTDDAADLGGLTRQQQAAMGQITGLNDGYASIGANGGLTRGQRGNVNTANDVAAGFEALTGNGGLSAVQSDAMGRTAGLGDAYGDLSSAYDQDAPGYARMRQQLLDDAVTNVARDFQASGRSGGGSYIDQATESSLNAIAPLDYQNYQNNINNQYRSLDSQKGIFDTLFGEGQTGVGNQVTGLTGQLGASGQAFGQQQQGTANELASLAGQTGLATTKFGMGQQAKDNDARAIEAQRMLLGDKFGMEQSGIQNVLASLAGQSGAAATKFGNRLAGLAGQQDAASSLFNAGQTGITNKNNALNALGQIGAAQDANSQGQLLGEADLFDRTNNAELDRLIKLGAAFGGNGPVDAANQAPWWQQMLGYVAGNAGKAVSGGLFGG